MASRSFSAEKFARLVNETIRSRGYTSTRIIKQGGSCYLWEDLRHNALAEMLVRPTSNDVVVRFIASRDGSRERAGESFAYGSTSTGLVARAIIGWINERNEFEMEKLVGRKQ